MSNIKTFVKPQYGIYAKYIKRLLDIILSFLALIFLSPIILFFTIIGTLKMRGNPFFLQKRPGQGEKIFSLIKFRTMTNQTDPHGKLLPDACRLTVYGKFLRSTSIDELPELINILKGDMSIIGPRPLLIKYLPLYNEYQRHRHDVRPGLTGYAQVHGRNAVSWQKKFEMDVEYVRHITFVGDMKILFETVFKVIKRDGISSGTSVTMEEFKGNIEDNI